ncbi:MAG TPA: hypothetical protein VF215_07200, partial [Thermoanaerobaculia bacterium]
GPAVGRQSRKAWPEGATRPAARIAMIAVLFLSVAWRGATPSSRETPGSIDGKIAVMAFPEAVDRNGDTQRIQANDCEVHLVQAEEQTTQWLYECGTWFQPPVGRYLFWLEQGSSVSFQSILSYAREPFTNAGLVLPKRMYPSGFVQLKEGAALPEGATFRAISLDSVENYRAYDRRIANRNAHRPTRMPIGPMLTGVFDRYGRALSLSTPQNVSVGKTTVVDPRTPTREQSDVLAVLSRSELGHPSPCNVTLTSNRQSIQPEVNFQIADRLVVAWYGLAAPAAMNLNVTCDNALPFVRMLYLEPGAILTVRSSIRKSLPLVPKQH